MFPQSHSCSFLLGSCHQHAQHRRLPLTFCSSYSRPTWVYGTCNPMGSGSFGVIMYVPGCGFMSGTLSFGARPSGTPSTMAHAGGRCQPAASLLQSEGPALLSANLSLETLSFLPIIRAPRASPAVARLLLWDERASLRGDRCHKALPVFTAFRSPGTHPARVHLWQSRGQHCTCGWRALCSYPRSEILGPT